MPCRGIPCRAEEQHAVPRGDMAWPYRAVPWAQGPIGPRAHGTRTLGHPWAPGPLGPWALGGPRAKVPCRAKFFCAAPCQVIPLSVPIFPVPCQECPRQRVRAMPKHLFPGAARRYVDTLQTMKLELNITPRVIMCSRSAKTSASLLETNQSSSRLQGIQSGPAANSFQNIKHAFACLSFSGRVRPSKGIWYSCMLRGILLQWST